MPRPRQRAQQGVVMLIVLFFSLLLTASVATFTRRSIVDAMVARNRDASAQAAALARGGVRLGTAMLVQDKISKSQNQVSIDSHLDPWAQLGTVEIPVGEDNRLRVEIEDSGGLFNLNSVFDFTKTGGEDGESAGDGVEYSETIPFLQEFFEKVIAEMDVPPDERVYDVTELSEALLDWVDADSDRREGGSEDDYYLDQDPPYRAQNGAIRSVDDLMLVEGFDRTLVSAIRPYVTVYPYFGATGINPNTAPAHVLSLLYFNDGSVDRLAKKAEVKEILAIRESGGLVCGPENTSHERCTPINIVNAIFPAPGYSSSAFTITAYATVGEIRRTVVAVVDRTEETPLLLSWKTK